MTLATDLSQTEEFRKWLERWCGSDVIAYQITGRVNDITQIEVERFMEVDSLTHWFKLVSESELIAMRENAHQIIQHAESVAGMWMRYRDDCTVPEWNALRDALNELAREVGFRI